MHYKAAMKIKMVDEPRRPRTISANWVLKRIQEGKNVRLRNALIEGDLDLNKLNLPTRRVERTELQKQMGLEENLKIVQSSIDIANSSILGKLDFRGATFSEHALFKVVTFGGDVTFFGTTFAGALFDGATFSKQAWFDGSTFAMDALFIGTTFAVALFEGVTFGGEAEFDRATFSDYADFKEATFCSGAWFEEATFCDQPMFEGAAFKERASFNRATFDEGADFSGASFNGAVYFNKTTFGGNSSFHRTAFNENAHFEAKFDGNSLTFRHATFSRAQSQEEACRGAKHVFAKVGNRDAEEYHFYREMEAKRIQKGIRGDSGLGLFYVLAKTETWSFWKFLWYDVIEYCFVQGMFGYGVHPKRLMISWGAIFLAFGFVYWYGKGIIGTTEWPDYFKVSFATAIAPGYIAAIINPGSAGYRLVPAFQIVAMIETIVGTFLWAGFIATFAKKYMR